MGLIKQDNNKLSYITNNFLASIVIFRRIGNMQEKLILQWGRFFYFQTKNANSFYSQTNVSSGAKTTTL